MPMKFELNTGNCASSIQKASNISPSKTGAAMLRSLWLKADKEKGTISFMTTDGSTEFTSVYPAQIYEDGFAGVQSKAFTVLFRSLPEGVVELEKKEQQLCLKQGMRNYKFPLAAEDWFQPFAEMKEEDPILWSGEAFNEIIEKVSFCVSDDEDSPLGCLYIRPSDDGTIHFCGLDGNKFAIRKITNSDLLSKLPDNGLLIQKKYLTDLRKLLPEDEIELAFDENRAFIRTKSKNGGEDMTSVPLVQFTYPDYSVFLARMNTEGCSTVRVNKKELCEALSRNLVFNTKDEFCVYISFDEGSMTLVSSDKSTGSAKEIIPATITGGIKRVAFITKGLLEILQHVDTPDEVIIRIASEEGPCSFESVSIKDYVVVAMPMRIATETYYEEENN